jgi:hypothetical protein
MFSAIKATDYLLTPKDVWHIVRDTFRRADERDWIGVIIILFFIAARLSPLLNIALRESLFLIFLFVIFYWRVDSRVSVGLGLSCLVIIPLLLVLYNARYLFEGDLYAEEVAVWAYYFLAIGVVKQIGEYIADSKVHKVEKVHKVRHEKSEEKERDSQNRKASRFRKARKIKKAYARKVRRAPVVKRKISL